MGAAHLARRITAVLLAAGLLSTGTLLRTATVGEAANGHADPGTQITNSATANYKDIQLHTYTTTSNTITITVQNAPSLTNTGGTGTAYAPGQIVRDTFVLLNTGNGSGIFQLVGDATLSGSDAGYATLGDGGSTCITPAGSQAAPCLYSATVGSTTYLFTSLSTSADNNALNYWLLHTNAVTAANASVTITAFYALSASALTGATDTAASGITSNIAYAAAGTAAAETSANQSATESNSVKPDARLDLYKSSTQENTSGDITYTIYAHDGGFFNAKDLLAAQTLLGAPAKGVLITDRVPVFNGAPLKLSGGGTVTTSTSVARGLAAGAVVDVYYSTSPTGGQGTWTKTTGALPTDGSVTFVGAYVRGGTCAIAGFELCADLGHVTSPGNVSVLSGYSLSLSFVAAQPNGPGAGEAGSATNLANGVIGDNMTVEHIVGPGIPPTTADAASSASLTLGGQGINNTTLTAVGGASNRTSNQALGAYLLAFGPLAANDSVGTYDEAAPVSTLDDFTAVSFGHVGDPIVNTGTVPGAPVTASTTGATVSTCVGTELQNDGNAADTFNVTAYVPTGFAVPTAGGQSVSGAFSAGGTQAAGWTVALYSDAGCTSLLGGSSPGAISSTAMNISLASNATIPIYAGYVIPSGTRYFARFDSILHAVSNGQPSKVDDTHVELYSSVLALTQTVTVTSTNCPPGVTPAYAAASACPGDALGYSFDARNIVIGQSDTNVSFAGTVADTSSLSDEDDGTVSASPSTTTLNNWGYFTNGLQAPPVSHASDGTVSAVLLLEYGFGTPHGAYTSTFAPGATAFRVDPIAGGQLVPRHYNSRSAAQDWMSTVTFTLTVK